MDNISDNLIQVYMDRFNNRPDVYGIQWCNGSQFGYKPVHKPMTVEVIKAHLAGEITIGFYSLNADNTSKWLCFDSDSANGQLDKLEQLFKDHHWHTIREGRRLGRDGHLWLLFDKPSSSIHLRQLGRLFLKNAGIAEDQIELFPKQDKINNLGNLIRAPLGIHRKPGADNARGWFDGVIQDISSQLNWFCSQPLNSMDKLLQLADEIEARELISNKGVHRVPAGKDRKTIDWIQYANSHCFKFDGSFWRGACPACKLIGHDKDNNHLWIGNLGAVGCWRGCTFDQIVGAVRTLN